MLLGEQRCSFCKGTLIQRHRCDIYPGEEGFLLWCYKCNKVEETNLPKPQTLEAIHSNIYKETGNREARFRVRNTQTLDDYLITGPSLVDNRRKKSLPPTTFQAFNYTTNVSTQLKAGYPFYALLSSQDEIDWLGSRHIEVIKDSLMENTKNAMASQTKEKNHRKTNLSGVWRGT